MGNSRLIHVKNMVPRQFLGFHETLHHIFYAYPNSLKKIIKKSHFHIHYYTNPLKLFMYQHVTPVYMTVYMNKKVYTLIYTKIGPKSSDLIRLIGQRQLSV